MRQNTDLLKNAGIDYEHGFSRYAGCAYHFNSALLFAARNPVFARIKCAYMQENAGVLYVYANELKRLAHNLGMAEVYEAASALSLLLRNGDYTAPSVDAALAVLDMATEATFSGIRGMCA